MKLLIYAKVKNIIDRWDPIGLVGIDPEHDHYRFEINEIIKLLQSNYSTPEELAKHVESIFIEYFDDEIYNRPFAECLNVARILVTINSD
ncbi:DUF1871 family protein [Brevibacillus sp. DP1.3A]|uniref:DUF1871 family protein n=1 Tax=Brevibacillus sp. DP1.3A TaxID=2738867 RepID=UPI00351D5568|nr:YugE family protein [Brevibacillus sp. DP1.3A]